MLTTKLLGQKVHTATPYFFVLSLSPEMCERLQKTAKKKNMKNYSRCRVDNVNKNMAHTTASQIALKECYTRNLCQKEEKMRDGSKNGKCQRTCFRALTLALTR